MESVSYQHSCNNATYTFAGDELYVRAKIVSTKLKENPYRQGEHEAAWVQPFVPVPPDDAPSP